MKVVLVYTGLVILLLVAAAFVGKTTFGGDKIISIERPFTAIAFIVTIVLGFLGK